MMDMLICFILAILQCMHTSSVVQYKQMQVLFVRGRKEKNRRNEPIRVIIHIYMEMSQWNSLKSLYQFIYKFICINNL
jgi:hypothetical protein